MINIPVWLIIAVAVILPNNEPALVIKEDPVMVTLEECIKASESMQNDKTTNRFVVCMLPVPESET